MHKIRSQAKQVGYSGDHGTTSKYNPFTRTPRARHPSNLRSEEPSLAAASYNDHVLQRRGHGPVTEVDGEPRRRSTTTRADTITYADDGVVSLSQSRPADKDDETISATGESRNDSNITSGQDSRPIHHTMELGTIKKAKFTIGSQMRVIFVESWAFLLLPFVPAGFAVNYTHQNPAIVFSINFIAIVPCTMMISQAVEEITIRTGDIIGSLLNMSFSNAAQLISSALLLKSRQITVLKTSLLGSIISNLLLMLGLCFVCGGYNRYEQCFNRTLAQSVSTMLFLSILGIIIPTVSHRLVSSITEHAIVIQSRGTSIIILISYGLYLLFQLKTHEKMFSTPSMKNAPRSTPQRVKLVPLKFLQSAAEQRSDDDKSDAEADDKPAPLLSLWTAALLMVISTVLLAFVAEFATDSIQQMVRNSTHLSQTFVGFVILPILSNDPTAIYVAYKDNVDLSFGVTLEKCMQTSMLVVPLLVVIDWCMSDEQMTLEFDGFSVSALFMSIIIVSYMIRDGTSNWLAGALLIQVYVIIALASYFIT